MPEVEEINNDSEAEMGLVIEGSYEWWPDSGDDAFLPVFDKYNKQNYYVEIFKPGKRSF